MLSKGKICLLVFLYGLAAFLLIFGVVVLIVMPGVIDQQVADMIPLTDDPKSQTYKAWVDPPAEIYMQFWVFHVNNSDEVEKGGKPIVKQIGPFTYEEKRLKTNITFHNNESVSYVEDKSFIFVPEMSIHSDSYIIKTLNLPLLVIANRLKHFPSAITYLISRIAEMIDKEPFIELSVKDLIFGYEDPLLKMVNSVLSRFNIHFQTHVGLFYGKNGTNDGLYTIRTGKDSLSDFMKITHWKYQSHLTYWTTKEANMINGTDGSMFHPFVKMTDRLYIFSSDICRSIYATYSSVSSVKGIPTYRFEPPPEVFADYKDNPDNIGFCTPNCLGSGVLNLTACQPGIPAVMSQPHFYQGDPKYINGVKGLNPNKECSTDLDIEPETGILLRANKRLQINMAIEPVSGFSRLDKIKPVFLPLTWLNESANVNQDSINLLKSQLFTPVTIITDVCYAALVLGVLLIIATTVGILFRVSERNKSNREDRTNLMSANGLAEEPLDHLPNHD